MLRIDTGRMAEGLYVAGHQEVERFDLVDIFLAFVELLQGTHDGWTGDRCAANRRLMFETWVLRWQFHRFANHAQPRLRNPFPILAFGIGRIQEMTESVLGPSIFFVVFAFS